MSDGSQEDDSWEERRRHDTQEVMDEDEKMRLDSSIKDWRPTAFVRSTGTDPTDTLSASGDRSSNAVLSSNAQNAYLPLPDSAWNPLAEAFVHPPQYAEFSHQDSFLRLCRELLDPILRTHRPAQKLHLLTAFIRTLPNQNPTPSTPTENQEKRDGSKDAGDAPVLLYPYVRLLLPHLDKERPNYQLKENKLAQLYREVLALPPKSPGAQRLVHWKDPRINAMQSETTAFGDVVYALLVERGGCGLAEGNETNKKTYHDKTVTPLHEDGGLFSIGEVNQLLDRLAQLSFLTATSGDAGGGGSRLSVHSQRVHLFQVCLRRMSPLEHKWLIRIILLDLKLGINHLSIFNVIHPEAWRVYTRTSSLAAVCSLAAPPRGSKMMRLKGNATTTREVGGSTEPKPIVCNSGVQVFHSCKPMLAAPFRVQHLDAMLKKEGQVGVEPKYDGERVLVHIQKNQKGLPLPLPAAAAVAISGRESGKGFNPNESSAMTSVAYRIQYLTRNGKDYTSVYAPTFNPILQRHLQYLDRSIVERRAALAQLPTTSSTTTTTQVPQFFSSCILDGEMMVYNKEAGDFAAFGFTRSFAMSAEAARLAEALADEDAIHTQPRASGVLSRLASTTDMNDGLREGGTTAASPRPYSEAVSRHWFCYMVFDILSFNDVSLLEVPLSQRREVLQCQVGLSSFSSPSSSSDPLQHHLELVPSTPHTTTTSILQALEHSLLTEKREGIVLKSYLSPYQPGERKPWWWMKLKHDHVAKLADTLDLIVVGAYYGTKFGRRQLTHFLLAAWKSKRTSPGASTPLAASSSSAVKPEPVHGSAASTARRGGVQSGSNDSASGTVNKSGTDGRGELELFHTVCKVGTGYTDEELTQVLQQLAPHWENPYASARAGGAGRIGTAAGTFTLSPFAAAAAAAAATSLPTLTPSTSVPLPVSQHAPPWLDGWVPAQRELLPDVYIHPRHSVVFEVMGYEFVDETDNYRIGFTLRFPRLLQVRWDKDVAQANSVEEVFAIRHASAEQLQLKLQACINAPGELETVLTSKHRARQRRRREEEEEEVRAPGAFGLTEVGEEMMSVFERASRLRKRAKKDEGHTVFASKQAEMEQLDTKGATTEEEREEEEEKKYATLIKREHPAVAGGASLPANSQLFKGYEFSILSFRPNPETSTGFPTPPTSTAQLESLLRRHGARVVANPLPHSTSLLLGDDPKDLRVVNWIAYASKAVAPPTARTKAASRTSTARHQKSFVSTDVARWEYVLECLVAQKIVPLTPRHMLYVSPTLRKKFDVLYDEFEDSYYEDASLESLRHSLQLARQKGARGIPSREGGNTALQVDGHDGDDNDDDDKVQGQHGVQLPLHNSRSAPSSVCLEWVHTWNRVHKTEAALFNPVGEDISVSENHKSIPATTSSTTIHMFPEGGDEASPSPLSFTPCRYAAVSWSAFESITEEASPEEGFGPSADAGFRRESPHPPHLALLGTWGRRSSRRHIVEQFNKWLQQANRVLPSRTGVDDDGEEADKEQKKGVCVGGKVERDINRGKKRSATTDLTATEALLLSPSETPPSELFLLGGEEEEESQGGAHFRPERVCRAIGDSALRGPKVDNGALKGKERAHSDTHAQVVGMPLRTATPIVRRGIAPRPLPPKEWTTAQLHRLLMFSVSQRGTSCAIPSPSSTSTTTSVDSVLCGSSSAHQSVGRQRCRRGPSAPDKGDSRSSNDPDRITHIVDPYGNVYRVPM